MTKQEIFTKVKNHLLTQNARSIDDGSIDDDIGMCRYRGSNGLMCAVGCLIPDDMYDPSMEGVSVDAIRQDNEALDEYLGSYSTINLLTDLQHLHDRRAVGSWPEELRRIAKLYDLNFDE